MKREPLSRVAWALLGASAAVVLWTVWLFGVALRYPSDGLRGYFGAQGLSVNYAPPGSLVQSGDVVLRVNGRALDRSLSVPGDWHAFLFAAPARQAEYTLLREGQELTVVVSWKQLPVRELLARAAPFLLVSGSFLAALWLIIFSRAREAATYWLALTLCIESGNFIFNLIPNLGANLALSLLWLYNPLDMLSFAWGMNAAFHVLTIFPERKRIAERWPWLPYALYALNTALVAVALWGGAGRSLLEMRVLMYGRALYPLAAMEILAGGALLAHTYLTTRTPGVRNQIRWLMWGILIGPLPWLLLYNLPIALTGVPLAPIVVVNLPLVLIPLALFFAVTRQGLMAVDTLINRSLVYGGVTGLLIALYLLMVGGVDWLLHAWMGDSGAEFAPLLAVVVVALAASPLHARLQGWVDRAFYRRWLDLKSLLREVGTRLSTTLEVETMAQLLTDEIPQRLQVTQAALLLRDAEGVFRAVGAHALVLEDATVIARHFETQGDAPLVLRRTQLGAFSGTVEQLAEQGWELVLPLRTLQQLVGLYLLGPRVTGDLYGQEELETLMFLGRQVGGTLENARLYQQVQRYSEDLEALVSERTGALERANLELGREHDRLNVIIQNMADGLLVTSLEGRVSLVNPAFEVMVSCSRAALLGVELRAVLDCAPLVQLVERAPDVPGQVLSIDCHLHQRVLRALTTALQDGSGVITVMRDVTHEAEVDRMKTEFISTVSHELRTPLTSVLGFTKLIAKSLERDVAPVLSGEGRALRSLTRAQANLDIIIAEGERLTRLINDVLDIAKMEAGKMEWHDHSFDLALVVHQAVQSVQGLAAEKSLPISVHLEGDLPALLADPDRIQQVLVNLLSNAVKFTDAGEITISARRVDAETLAARWMYPTENRGGILVAVHDTGIGIPAEELPGLFRRFKQVREDALINKPKGTGLGLAISREVITHYGGVIWADSEPGSGSAFTFVLPLSELEVQRAAPVLPMLHQLRERVLPHVAVDSDHPATVLVVDDEPSIRALLHQELTEAGYHVLEAAHGTEALALARRHRPAIILLDVMMPDLSGFEVTQILKSDPATENIPILILSIIEDHEHGLALGADAYLTKPVETGPLLNTISSLISQSPVRPTAMVAGKDRSVLEGITHLLREQGFEVVEAYDPRGAILTAQQVKPDLVILDEMLSRLNDAEVIKALRFQEQAQAYTIIVVAGSGPEGAEDA